MTENTDLSFAGEDMYGPEPQRGFRLHADTLEVSSNLGTVALRESRFAILSVLGDEQGNILPRIDLQKRAWGTPSKKMLYILNNDIDGLGRDLREVQLEDCLVTLQGFGVGFQLQARGSENIPEIAPGLYLDTHRLYAASKPDLKLSPTESKALQFLWENSGGIVSHANILDAVWGTTENYDYEIVRVIVYKLRKKLNEAGYPLIHTITGKGYYFGYWMSSDLSTGNT